MPVILDREDYGYWLEGGRDEPQQVLPLLKRRPTACSRHRSAALPKKGVWNSMDCACGGQNHNTHSSRHLFWAKPRSGLWQFRFGRRSGMHSSILSAILLVGTLTQAALSADRELNADVTYKRMCDASAAVALSPERFVVASDEGAKLRIYRYGQEQPEVEQDLADFLDLEGDPEAD